MSYDKKLVAEKLRRWDKYLDNYRLPTWEAIPDLGLYMEQVIVLLSQYMDYLPPELREEQFVTAATINNYVRMKIMPEPKKKRYYRIHLAYLILILTFKQGLSIQMITKLVPPGLSEGELEEIYRRYAERHRMVSEYFIDQVRRAAAPILERQETSCISSTEPETLIAMAAMFGGLSRLLAEKLLFLEGKSTEKAAEADTSASAVEVLPVLETAIPEESVVLGAETATDGF